MVQGYSYYACPPILQYSTGIVPQFMTYLYAVLRYLDFECSMRCVVHLIDFSGTATALTRSALTPLYNPTLVVAVILRLRCLARSFIGLPSFLFSVPTSHLLPPPHTTPPSLHAPKNLCHGHIQIEHHEFTC